MTTTDQQADDRYLIRKRGAFYRPNAEGYTNNRAEAGRYTLAQAIWHSHPNGPNGPRDGIDYMRDDEPAAPCLASVSSASAEGRVVATAKRLSAMMGCEFVPHATGADDAQVASPEPVPATNQAGEVERGLIQDLLWVIDRSHGHRHVEHAERARAYLAIQHATSHERKDVPTATSHDAYRLRKVAEADCGCRIPAPFDEVADHLAALSFDEGVKRCLATQPATSQEGEAVKLPDGFVHPDDFAREYQASVNGKMPVPGHADGCGVHDDYACDCAVTRLATSQTGKPQAAWADHQAKPWQFRRWIKHTGLRLLGLVP